ncbi:TD and POZ domain-containing protein 5 [Trichonephila inaurata madagascariensis]|uniref:TD and POZ domain-containing protein 5 n=1 Tax=Trichonephila inaurata madagascariensis TaxID=2747483 RepID=A0A8X6X8T1_9ARAC|nr:TD and POZ domain-containing protein 5 [Trichonephila inaurata madagascariensis]
MKISSGIFYVEWETTKVLRVFLEILGSNGSVLLKQYAANSAFVKGKIWGWSEFSKRKRVLQLEKDRFLPLNTLTARCRMRRCENRSQERVQMYAKTVINFEKLSFIWSIEKFNSLKLEQKIPFVVKSTSQEVLMTLNLFLCQLQHSDEIIFIDFNCVNKKLKYFLFKVFLINNRADNIGCNQREIWYEAYEKKRDV